eukprot:CAMPEP_0115847980 /NCGR_PEP_ID=MMETSP0287-20121206/10675_1 /TAXON_ID=412157 /ORGANISM="Chrysochromulina rotalis, Strain UIO044" /LENGTH=87 /DNA_ID=CAMNT_0003301857 /DNA_START=516 /DNA_END=779 /DNA_ORIENTATION=-
MPFTGTKEMKWNSRSAFGLGASVCPCGATPSWSSRMADPKSLPRSCALAPFASLANPASLPLPLLTFPMQFITVCIRATAPQALPIV